PGPAGRVAGGSAGPGVPAEGHRGGAPTVQSAPLSDQRGGLGGARHDQAVAGLGEFAGGHRDGPGHRRGADPAEHRIAAVRRPDVGGGAAPAAALPGRRRLTCGGRNTQPVPRRYPRRARLCAHRSADDHRTPAPHPPYSENRAAGVGAPPRSKEVMVNVTLGVFVESGTARIVLVDADPPNPVVDQTDLDLAAADSTPDTLVTTVLATAGALTESGHRLVGISLCGPAADRIGPVHDALTGSGLRPVTVVDESDAVTAVVRTLAGDETVATLVNDGATVALSMTEAGGVTTPVATEPVDGDPQAAYRTLVERFAADPGAASGLIVMGSLGDGGLPADLVETSPVPLRFPDDPEFMLARGAALASLSQ